MVTEQTQAEDAQTEEPFAEEFKPLERRTFEMGHGTTDCPRCGDEHEGLPVVAFYQPVLDHKDGLAWRWWSKCPTTGDPILIAERPV